MTTLSPELALALIVTSGVGVAMVMSGMRRSALVRRQSSRRCPACGRIIRSGQVCDCSHR